MVLDIWRVDKQLGKVQVRCAKIPDRAHQGLWDGEGTGLLGVVGGAGEEGSWLDVKLRCLRGGGLGSWSGCEVTLQGLV